MSDGGYDSKPTAEKSKSGQKSKSGAPKPKKLEPIEVRMLAVRENNVERIASFSHGSEHGIALFDQGEFLGDGLADRKFKVGDVTPGNCSAATQETKAALQHEPLRMARIERSGTVVDSD